MSYDKGCYDLGAAFLDDYSKITVSEKRELAQAIQDCIEDWIKANIDTSDDLDEDTQD